MEKIEPFATIYLPHAEGKTVHVSNGILAYQHGEDVYLYKIPNEKLDNVMSILISKLDKIK